MTSKQIRERFLSFFKEKGHKIVPSAPIVVKDDPTLMFTNAGMNQFKDVFLGNKQPDASRIADTQKCLRVSGKHNDLEEVGVDTYHHTMFEMLGNWSFGDYFKAEAIAWAWELLVDVYGIDKSKLYVTIFEGDDEDHLEADEESRDIWAKYIDPSRILPFGKKDNFWEMGATGPCGPCSEIHIDLRSEEEKAQKPGHELVNEGHPKVIEIWNLVFMEFNRKADGGLVNLPSKHVDTGMGFERLSAVLQGKSSNYDSDVFTPLIKAVEEHTGFNYGTDEKIDIAIRVIVDHLRTISFSIADGQLPSNTGAGYVIRRILRRAVRYSYTYLNQEQPLLNQLVARLVEQMGDFFLELKAQQSFIEKVILEEEQSFLRTLGQGIRRFEAIVEQGSDTKTVDGEKAFELYDTYGFPIDLTRLMANDIGWQVDMHGFEKALQQQKNRSKDAASVDKDDWVVLLDDNKEGFIGYDHTTADVRITRYRKVKVKDKEQYQLVFNLTPFYAESGGQVGDTGYIEANGEKVSIKDTQKENDLIIHFTDKLPTDPSAEFKAVVNQDKRLTTQYNHSATHLLHQALREVLGTHVEQKGSLVSPDYLRFDFSHFQKMTDEEIAKVEDLVNQRIRENHRLEEDRAVPFKEAREMGAIALFGEKYGDVVRVIKFGESVELCGGTHVKATGDIGVLKIVTETSVAAGVRRIEAYSGQKALDYVNAKLHDLEAISATVKATGNPVQSVNQLWQENQQLKKELDKLAAMRVTQVKNELKGKVQSSNGVNYITEVVDLGSADDIKNLAYGLKNEIDNLFLALGADLGGKANLTLMFDDKLVKEKELHAGNLIRELAKEIQGGGGGQPFFATAGGKNPAGLQKALAKAKEIVEGLV